MKGIFAEQADVTWVGAERNSVCSPDGLEPAYRSLIASESDPTSQAIRDVRVAVERIDDD